MAELDSLNTHPPEFERFLHASVGEDRNGYVVTVLSKLARLETLLARFRGVPALTSDHGRVVRDLSELLPEGRSSGSLTRTASTVADGRPGAGRATRTILAILLGPFQALRVGGSVSGE